MRIFSSVLVTQDWNCGPGKPCMPAKALQAINPGPTNKQLKGCSILTFDSATGKKSSSLCGQWLTLHGWCITYYLKGLLLLVIFLTADYLVCLSSVHWDLFIKAFQSSISGACPWNVSLFWASLPLFSPITLAYSVSSVKKNPTMPGLRWPSLQPRQTLSEMWSSPELAAEQENAGCTQEHALYMSTHSPFPVSFSGRASPVFFTWSETLSLAQSVLSRGQAETSCDQQESKWLNIILQTSK